MNLPNFGYLNRRRLPADLHIGSPSQTCANSGWTSPHCRLIDSNLWLWSALADSVPPTATQSLIRSSLKPHLLHFVGELKRAKFGAPKLGFPLYACFASENQSPCLRICLKIWGSLWCSFRSFKTDSDIQFGPHLTSFGSLLVTNY